MSYVLKIYYFLNDKGVEDEVVISNKSRENTDVD